MVINGIRNRRNDESERLSGSNVSMQIMRIGPAQSYTLNFLRLYLRVSAESALKPLTDWTQAFHHGKWLTLTGWSDASVLLASAPRKWLTLTNAPNAAHSPGV
jgi:hypothetical protein